MARYDHWAVLTAGIRSALGRTGVPNPNRTVPTDMISDVCPKGIPRTASMSASPSSVEVSQWYAAFFFLKVHESERR